VKPLVNSFAATRNPVPRGTATVLAWDVNPTATNVTISPDIGSVLSRTTNGVGTIAATPTDTMTYTLTVERNGVAEETNIPVTVTEPLPATAPS